MIIRVVFILYILLQIDPILYFSLLWPWQNNWPYNGSSCSLPPSPGTNGSIPQGPCKGLFKYGMPDLLPRRLILPCRTKRVVKCTPDQKVLEGPLLSMWNGCSVSTEPTPATDLAHEPTSTTEPEPAIMSITRPEPTARSITESTPATQPLPEPEKSCIFDLWSKDSFPFPLCLYCLSPRISSLRWWHPVLCLRLLRRCRTAPRLCPHCGIQPQASPPGQPCDTNPLAVPRASEPMSSTFIHCCIGLLQPEDLLRLLVSGYVCTTTVVFGLSVYVCL